MYVQQKIAPQSWILYAFKELAVNVINLHLGLSFNLGIEEIFDIVYLKLC